MAFLGPDGASFRLYSGPLSMFGAKAQIAILEKNLGHEVIMVPFDMERLYEPKHPEVARINPKQQVPVLVHGGIEIFDSTQIFEYLEDLAPDPPLWPFDRAARAQARLLELMSDEVFFPPVVRLMNLQDRLEGPAAVAAQTAIAQHYMQHYMQMDHRLSQAECLAATYSYADIAFYMAQFFAERMSAPMTDATPRLLAWRERVTARPAVQQVMGAMAAFLTAHGRPVPAFVHRGP